MGELFVVDPALLSMASLALSLVFLILVIILWSKLNRLKRNYHRLLNGTEHANMEEVMIRIQERLNVQQENVELQEMKISEITGHLKKMKSHIGFHRYNAFADSGGDLSFSIAIMNEEQDGIVMTAIQSREQTYIYAKPIENGVSSYTLSPEEKEAVNQVQMQQLQAK
jgi:hypothetical protein